MNLRIPPTILAILGLLAVSGAQAQTDMTATTNTADAIVLPARFNDPLEPFNRGTWAINKALMTYAVKPFSTGYRHVVIKPIRTGISNAGKNFRFPGRLLNNMLQGRWDDANEEAERCFCNTIFGLGGWFDVATKWGIGKHDTTFGQTFRQWGWHPQFYLMLPILGPSDERDGIGLIGDYGDDPLSYFFPWQYVSSGVGVNNITDSVDGYVRFSQEEADPYSILEYAWSFAQENRKPDMSLIGEQDQPTLETLGSVFVGFTNIAFPEQGKTRSVFIPSTKKKLKFTYWLQPNPAPVVYMVPGLGAHRLAGNQLALAELVYKNGYSCVSISSAFHPEFMEHASTTDLPAYPPTGIEDTHVALTEIDHQLEKWYPHRLGARALMGYSMGGFTTLFVASQAATNQGSLLKFDRFVAIDSPVRLRYCVTNVDKFYDAALEWPAEQRTANIENLLLKVVALSQNPPQPGANLPFNAIESKFLIGLSFRLTLRDMIFSSQLRHNQGVLKTPLKSMSRRVAYDEIMQYSLISYIRKFAAPYDKTRGIDLADDDVVEKGTDLRVYAGNLQANPNIRIVANRNDLFLASEDVGWIEGTFSSRARLFDHGGHLGNLSQPEVRQAILDALDGLKEPQAKPVAGTDFRGRELSQNLTQGK